MVIVIALFSVSNSYEITKVAKFPWLVKYWGSKWVNKEDGAEGAKQMKLLRVGGITAGNIIIYLKWSTSKGIFFFPKKTSLLLLCS